jgi:hypothetical protein
MDPDVTVRLVPHGFMGCSRLLHAANSRHGVCVFEASGMTHVSIPTD